MPCLCVGGLEICSWTTFSIFFSCAEREVKCRHSNARSLSLHGNVDTSWGPPIVSQMLGQPPVFSRKRLAPCHERSQPSISTFLSVEGLRTCHHWLVIDSDSTCGAFFCCGSAGIHFHHTNVFPTHRLWEPKTNTWRTKFSSCRGCQQTPSRIERKKVAVMRV